MCSPPARERGAVLVLALLVALVVSALATTLYLRFDAGLRDAGNAAHGAQLREYLLGAEQLALVAIAADSASSDATDHLGEVWARTPPVYPIPGGQVSARLQDAQARLDLNSLAARVRTASAVPGAAGRFSPAQRRFIRLLQTLEDVAISEAEAVAITEAVVDYIDEDHQVFGFGGAESDWYAAQSPPRRAANGPLTSVSELREVRGISPALYRALAPYVVALPQPAALNLNTAPLALLRSINREDRLDPLPAVTAARWIAERGEQGFASVDAFIGGAASQDLLRPEAAQLSTEGLSVRSNWFLVISDVQLEGRQRRQLSLLHRDANGQRISLRRPLSPLAGLEIL
ncbi:MAG: type II secretion system minor pseudopilin GspK [Spongiibacteraceae bacterium]|nr:type II secretion system minor pseudopilin GspK [Spongiibacteraceae bacterium]